MNPFLALFVTPPPTGLSHTRFLRLRHFTVTQPPLHNADFVPRPYPSIQQCTQRPAGCDVPRLQATLSCSLTAAPANNIGNAITLPTNCCVCNLRLLLWYSGAAGRWISDRRLSTGHISATWPTAMRGRPSPCPSSERCRRFWNRSSDGNQARSQSSVFDGHTTEALADN